MDSEQADLWTRSCRYLLLEDAEVDKCPEYREHSDAMGQDDCAFEDLSSAQQDEYWLRVQKRLGTVMQMLGDQPDVRSPNSVFSISGAGRGGMRRLREKCGGIYTE
ncbi:hypothetical protein N8I77_002109 [Diaporthe amygdali]|uniref:Uncharacterized protein n=1 Tax=Phomopsis amygdali TaxID=1214568 RepID=A0AAD9WAU3_PHOAM|nr:hypothetical protein N8I77_002109 [Diaporthe amygdali]